MGLTSQERVRRHRAHHRGDHQWCDPEVCNGEALALTRGNRLLLDLRRERTLSAAEDQLAKRAGALVDRLAELDAYLAGQRGDWLRAALEGVTCGHAITVRVDTALSEIRQQEMALTRVLGELRQSGTAAARAKARGITEPPAELPTRPGEPADSGDEYGDLFAVGAPDSG